MAKPSQWSSNQHRVGNIYTTKTILILVLMLAGCCSAQSRLTGPTPAGYGPTYDVSLGYSYLSSYIPQSGQANLYGFEATGHADFLPHWGVAVDAGYVRTSNVLDTGHSGYTLTFLGGPVFYPIDRGRTKAFLHALVGAGLVDSAVPLSSTQELHGWVERPAYAVGGGVERSFFGPFGFRLSGDYLRTDYASSTGTVQAQNNLRVTASFVFRLNRSSSW
jgi:hypothetical protein